MRMHNTTKFERFSETQKTWFIVCFLLMLVFAVVFSIQVGCLFNGLLGMITFGSFLGVLVGIAHHIGIKTISSE